MLLGEEQFALLAVLGAPLQGPPHRHAELLRAAALQLKGAPACTEQYFVNIDKRVTIRDGFGSQLGQGTRFCCSFGTSRVSRAIHSRSLSRASRRGADVSGRVTCR